MMIFWRHSDEIHMSCHMNRREIETWLSTPGDDGGGAGLKDAMAGNGLRKETEDEIKDMISGRRPQLPGDSFIVINGDPIKLETVEVVTRYRFPGH